jgi:hypothetical protein
LSSGAVPPETSQTASQAACQIAGERSQRVRWLRSGIHAIDPETNACLTPSQRQTMPHLIQFNPIWWLGNSLH